MSNTTYDTILAAANVIASETTKKANTAARIGGQFVDTLNYAKGIGESAATSINAVDAKVSNCVKEEYCDIEPASADWAYGRYSYDTGTEAASSASSTSTETFRITIDGVTKNYIVKNLRTKNIPSTASVIKSENTSIWFRLSAWDTDGTYLGVYDIATDTFIKTYASNRITSVYQSASMSSIRSKYPNYTWAIVIGDISSAITLNPNDIADYISYGAPMFGTIEQAYKDSLKPCEYSGTEISIFKKGLFIGDSLTAGTFNHNESGTMVYEVIPQYSYPTIIGRKLGIEVTNKGDGGKTTSTWWDAHSADTNYSGHDFCIIQLGVNDVGKQSGGWNDASTAALKNIIAKVQSENKKIKVFVATIIPSSYYKGTNSNTGGKYDDASAAIRSAVASLADDNVILLDIAAHGHTGASCYSNGHLNALGYERLAQDYINYIGWYIKNNISQFTQTAFIGTDWSFT